jgi:DsbC/DsbD-like thiol-disulfide interchange protein
MNTLQTLFLSTALCAASSAAVRSGSATADWITASATVTGGTPVTTGLRLAMDPGHHTYWENPGEGGMKISVKWQLPPGWKAADPTFPVPQRFVTGDLVGFGYDGTVIFPVSVTPPADFSGKATLKVAFSWLTCDDKGCIPGNADLELALTAGDPAPTPDVEAIAAALRRVPLTPPSRISLKVAEKPKSLVLTIAGLNNPNIDLTTYQVFPATPQVVENAARIGFTRDGGNWTTEVPKNEYLTQPARELTLVLAGKAGDAPISLTWKAAAADTTE